MPEVAPSPATKATTTLNVSREPVWVDSDGSSGSEVASGTPTDSDCYEKNFTKFFPFRLVGLTVGSLYWLSETCFCFAFKIEIR